ncbi:MAG TPA: inositol monophosphatase family protein [Nitrososphaerales archaeon]|nr:inositol monophosphatase family protein [Nitrososphaerales archaeon]
MKPEEWEKLLLGVTERVRGKISPLSRRGERGKSVGVGASGDRTLLADKVAEDELMKCLLGVSGTRVLSEEAGYAGDPDGDTLAVVDPLDGSSNFARGIPFYCTSVAVVEGNALKDIKVGVVRDLVTGDVYHAVKGKGTKRNGVPVQASRVEDLSRAVVSIDISRGGADLIARVAPLITVASRQVHFGANALELSRVSDGTIDAFIDIRGKIRITDLAAAYLVAVEAGAEISDDHGNELRVVFDLEHRLRFVASANMRLHEEILRLCGPAAPREASKR